MEGNVWPRAPGGGACDRLANSVPLVGLGFLLLVASLCATGFNEYRSVATIRTIDLGRKYLVESPCAPDAKNSKQLVHVACDLAGMKPLGSNIVGLQDLPAEERVGLRLESKCEVREWLESSQTESDSSGKKRTEYTYARAWSTTFVDSKKFKDPIACSAVNNKDPCVNTDPEDQSWWTNDMNINSAAPFYTVESVNILSVGGFNIPLDMRAKLGADPAPVFPKLDCSKALHCPPGVKVDGIYASYNDMLGPKTSPSPMRRQFRIANVSHASVIAQQMGNSFVPWTSPYDKRYSLYYIADGVMDADDMLLAAEGENRHVTWILRGVTLVCTFLGIQMMLAPVEAIAALVPCFGPCLANLAGCAICVFSFLVASSCWLLVCGTSWIYFRPELGVPLLAGGAGLLCASSCWQLCRAPAEHQRQADRANASDRAGDAEASAPLLAPGEDDACCSSGEGLEAGSRPPPLNPASRTAQGRGGERAADEEHECVVCMVNSKTRLLRPCGHVCVCDACAKQVKACPVCRSHISEAIRAYV